MANVRTLTGVRGLATLPLRLIAAAFAMALSLATAPAHADDAKHSTASIIIGARCCDASTVLTGSDGYENTVSYTGTNGFSSATVSIPHGLVEVHGNGIACPLCPGGAVATAQADYFFRATGDGPYGYVPILVTYHLSGMVTGYGVADAIIAINPYHTPTDFPLSGFSDFGALGSGQQYQSFDFTRTTTFYAQLFTWNDLRLTAAGSSSDVIATGSFEAMADPFIRIDPAFLAANPGYGFEFSVGANDGAPGGAGTVPEPAVWLLLVAGFGFTGATMRRRQSALIA